MADTKNLCAQIPTPLHNLVRERQEASGMNLSAYITMLITEFYKMKEENQNMNTKTRTVAVQVPPELFEEFKAYLQRNGLKQKDFFLTCIQNALAEERNVDTATGTAPEPQGPAQTE